MREYLKAKNRKIFFVLDNTVYNSPILRTVVDYNFISRSSIKAYIENIATDCICGEEFETKLKKLQRKRNRKLLLQCCSAVLLTMTLEMVYPAPPFIKFLQALIYFSFIGIGYLYQAFDMHNEFNRISGKYDKQWFEHHYFSNIDNMISLPITKDSSTSPFLQTFLPFGKKIQKLSWISNKIEGVLNPIYSTVQSQTKKKKERRKTTEIEDCVNKMAEVGLKHNAKNICRIEYFMHLINGGRDYNFWEEGKIKKSKALAKKWDYDFNVFSDFLKEDANYIYKFLNVGATRNDASNYESWNKLVEFFILTNEHDAKNKLLEFLKKHRK